MRGKEASATPRSEARQRQQATRQNPVRADSVIVRPARAVATRVRPADRPSWELVCPASARIDLKTKSGSRNRPSEPRRTGDLPILIRCQFGLTPAAPRARGSTGRSKTRWGRSPSAHSRGMLWSVAGSRTTAPTSPRAREAASPSGQRPREANRPPRAGLPAVSAALYPVFSTARSRLASSLADRTAGSDDDCVPLSGLRIGRRPWRARGSLSARTGACRSRVRSDVRSPSSFRRDAASRSPARCLARLSRCRSQPPRR